RERNFPGFSRKIVQSSNNAETFDRLQAFTSISQIDSSIISLLGTVHQGEELPIVFGNLLRLLRRGRRNSAPSQSLQGLLGQPGFRRSLQLFEPKQGRDNIGIRLCYPLIDSQESIIPRSVEFSQVLERGNEIPGNITQSLPEGSS